MDSTKESIVRIYILYRNPEDEMKWSQSVFDEWSFRDKSYFRKSV